MAIVTGGYHCPFAHGLMFHHFKNEVHPDGQGAITSEDFDRIINYAGIERFLSASDWTNRQLEKSLDKKSLCITFDDALMCQYEVAKPVLDSYGLKAFFFVYSSPLLGTVEPLEVYRYYRSTQFEAINDFYELFFKIASELGFGEEVRKGLSSFEPREYLQGFSFYTNEDRTFRYVRDLILGPKKYFEVMDRMIAESCLDKEELLKFLWMGEEHIKTLSEEGHVIGLHSFSHPTRMNSLSLEQQMEEFSKNKSHLQNLLGRPITTMSHPCNSYNEDTLQVLSDINIDLGFRANMAPGFNSNFEIPREDHINVHKELAGLK